MVRRLDHIEVVFDNDNRIARVPQVLKDVEELMDICEVEARCRLIEDIEGLPRRPLG